MLRRLHQFRRWAGVDRTVFFSNAAQLTRLFTGPITILLVLRYLTPEIQGYFYNFAPVVGLQVFLEVGFSQNILQFASHEYAKLRFNEAGVLEGDLVARSRLISLGRLAFRYYAAAGAIFLFTVGIGGHVFFTLSTQHAAAASPAAASAPVAWQGAWWLIAVSAALTLVINPVWSLLQGCNQVATVAKFNFWAALVAFGVNAVALISGAGIYASAITSIFNLVLSVIYLWLRWRPFLRQFRELPRHGQVSWAREIWPFQWRIAVSWISNFLIFDIVNPIALYCCGPVAAGRIGMSFQLLNMIARVALTWSWSKGPRFGMLVANRAWAELDALWRRSTLQAFVFYLLGFGSFLLALPVVGHFIPKVSVRLAPFPVNAWIGAGLITQVLVSAMAMELRAHKREPFMWVSVLNAILSLAFILPLVYYWGIMGEAIGYALALWIVFVPNYCIFRAKRLEYRHVADAPLAGGIGLA